MNDTKYGRWALGVFGKFWGCVKEKFLGERHAQPVFVPVPRDHAARPRHSAAAFHDNGHPVVAGLGCDRPML